MQNSTAVEACCPGDPFERDPAAVARDVRLGYVSRDRAASDYGVAIADDHRVDAAATRALRGRGAAS